MSTPDSGCIRIIIVDDHAILRAGLRMLIEGERDMLVAGEAGDCASAFAVVASEQPDILLLDLDLKAIKKVHAGEVWLDRSMMAKVLSEMTQSGEPKQDAAETAKIAALTGREREVIALISEGAGTRQVASQLFISEKTVRNHLASIYSKLDISDRLELVLYAQRHNLTKPSL